MTNTTPNQQLDLQDIDDGDSIDSTQQVRKRAKFVGIPKPKEKELKNKAPSRSLSTVHTPQSTGPHLVVSLATELPIVASSDKVGEPMSTRPPTMSPHEPPIIFLENLPKPTTDTALPVFLNRIEKTEQLVYCNTLLLQGEKARNTTDNVVQTEPTLTDNERQWLVEMNSMEMAHVRWLATRMAEEFIQVTVKDSDKIAENVALGPVLDREFYRKLLSCFIRGFEDARILDADILQGLVEEHEPLSGVLSGLKSSADPYLMYQACYALQALQYISDDKTALQVVLQHSAGVVDGLVKVSAVFVEDQAVKTTAHTLLQEFKRNQGTVSSLPCPLRNRPPPPTSSPILARVRNIPYVENILNLHKVQRLRQSTQSVYIPPLAKPSQKAKDEDLFPLMEKVQEFLQSKRQVMLVLGDSGAGKSTFNRYLEHRLWTEYKQGSCIPLFINLPAIDRPEQDMITKQLRNYNFNDDQIQELKLHRQLVLICDGYDESQQLVNLHYTNMLNQPGQWNTKMIISCRTQFLGPNYIDRFKPLSNDRYASGLHDVFQQAVIAPFTEGQVESYVEQYAQDPATEKSDKVLWTAEEYMDKLGSIPSVMDLVKNPFLLTLALKALPSLVASDKDLASIHVTRAGLYDMFIDQWLETNRVRLQLSALKDVEQEALSALVDDDFIAQGIVYLLRLSTAIFREQDGNPIVQYTHRQDKNSWKAEFFGTDPEVKLLRDASPLTRIGNQYRFVHRSVLEYLFSRAIYNPTKNDEEFDPQAEAVPAAVAQHLDPNGPLFERDLLQEPSVINFLCDRVKLNLVFKHQLHAAIDRSKTDASASIAATNAITILVRAGVSFNGADLRCARISCADLSNGQFDSAQFQGADLTDVNLSKSWLRQADLSDTHMGGVQFGELPYLEMENPVRSCTYSPDGKMLGVALDNGIIYIYDASTWTRMHRLDGHSDRVNSIIFSPDSQRLASGSDDKTVRLWDTSSGEELLVMKKRCKYVFSATISPCGNRIASADGGTVRLWDAQTGECLFVWKGHTSSVMSVKYSPDGGQLVSGSLDGTIRFWDPRTGESGVILKPHSGCVNCIAYSPDGRWITAGHDKGQLKLWNAVSLAPGPILSGHTEGITGIDFSPDGQYIASIGDQTVKLWDVSTSALITVLTGHSHQVNCVAFSPDGGPIVSGGDDRKVRLWEAGSSWSSLGPRDGGPVQRLAYSPDGRSILSYDKGRLFRQWDAATGTSAPIPFELPEQKMTTSRAYALDGNQFAFGYDDGSIRLWYCQIGTAGPVLKGHTWRIAILVYSPCCRWIVSVDVSNIVRLWDLHDEALQPLLVDFGENLNADLDGVTFSANGGYFAIRTVWCIIYHFDTQSRECLGRVRLDGRISSMVYSPNDQQIAIGTQEGWIYLRDLQSKESGAILEGHEDTVEGIAYSPCGQWISSACDDMTVGIWHRQLSGEVESWSRVHSICAFFGWVGNVAWNPVVPMELVTSTSDGSVQVWRMTIEEGGKVVIKMVWGPNLGTLCTEGATFRNAVGLIPIYQKLLVQRGAVFPSDEPTVRHE